MGTKHFLAWPVLHLDVIFPLINQKHWGPHWTGLRKQSMWKSCWFSPHHCWNGWLACYDYWEDQPGNWSRVSHATCVLILVHCMPVHGLSWLGVPLHLIPGPPLWASIDSPIMKFPEMLHTQGEPDCTCTAGSLPFEPFCLMLISSCQDTLVAYWIKEMTSTWTLPGSTWTLPCGNISSHKESNEAHPVMYTMWSSW